jgi:D-glycero-beta-D-manno-heptose 1-phosphate adenylyltransferase
LQRAHEFKRLKLSATPHLLAPPFQILMRTATSKFIATNHEDTMGDAQKRMISALPKPLVFTNGVFDVLHRGHVTYLEAARTLGGSLIVALNTDASAKRLGKGPDRPLNNQQDRALVIAALESVDAVTWFDEDTPYELIDALKPDIIVKGGDYNMAALREGQLVQSYGGQAMALSFVDGYSTTTLVQRIRQAQPSGGAAKT